MARGKAWGWRTAMVCLALLLMLGARIVATEITRSVTEVGRVITEPVCREVLRSDGVGRDSECRAEVVVGDQRRAVQVSSGTSVGDEVSVRLDRRTGGIRGSGGSGLDVFVVVLLLGGAVAALLAVPRSLRARLRRRWLRWRTRRAGF